MDAGDGQVPQHMSPSRRLRSGRPMLQLMAASIISGRPRHGVEAPGACVGTEERATLDHAARDLENWGWCGSRISSGCLPGIAWDAARRGVVPALLVVSENTPLSLIVDSHAAFEGDGEGVEDGLPTVRPSVE